MSPAALAVIPPRDIERRADKDLYEGLSQRVRLRAYARQMGNFSVRVPPPASRSGIAVALLDLTAIGQYLPPSRATAGCCAASTGIPDPFNPKSARRRRSRPWAATPDGAALLFARGGWLFDDQCITDGAKLDVPVGPHG